MLLALFTVFAGKSIPNYRLSKIYLGVIEEIEKKKEYYETNENLCRKCILNELYIQYNSEKPKLEVTELQKSHDERLISELIRLINENYIIKSNDNKIMLTKEGIDIVKNIKQMTER